MTPDVIGAIIAAFGGAATVLAGVWAMNGRMLRAIDARLDRVETRIDRVETRIDRIETRMQHIENELVEVKIAIARIEGPQQRLIRPAH